MPRAPQPPRRAPSGLGEAGLRIWREVKAELKDEGRWHETNYELLERYVRNVLRANEAAREAAKAPYTTGSRGQPVAHPAQKIAREAELDAHRYAEALLITPAARERRATEGEDDQGELGF